MLHLAELVKDINLNECSSMGFNAIRSHLMSELLYMYIRPFGYLVRVTSIMGFTERTNGNPYLLRVYFKALLLLPIEREIFFGTVSNITEIGIYVDVGPLRSFISRAELPDGLKFCASTRKYANDVSSVEVYDTVPIRVYDLYEKENGLMVIGHLSPKYRLFKN